MNSINKRFERLNKQRNRMLAKDIQYMKEQIRGKIKICYDLSYVEDKQWFIESSKYIESFKCEICEKDFEENKCIDHCHKTDKIRGILCNNCNIGLGMFKDDVNVMVKAINYMMRFNNYQTCG